MSKTLGETLQTAAAHLNDYGQTFWEKGNLINFLQEAHRELQIHLYLGGLPVIKKKSPIIQVVGVANPTSGQEGNLGTDQPTDLIEPIELWERESGSSDDFERIQQKSWDPEILPVNEIIYWTWQGELVKYLVPTSNREVKLYYNAGIPIPEQEGDLLGFIWAELYIAPRTAAIAARTIGGKQAYAELTQMANQRLDMIISANIKGQQALPVRRRPYRHGRTSILR